MLQSLSHVTGVLARFHSDNSTAAGPCWRQFPYVVTGHSDCELHPLSDEETNFLFTNKKLFRILPLAGERAKDKQMSARTDSYMFRRDYMGHSIVVQATCIPSKERYLLLVKVDKEPTDTAISFHPREDMLELMDEALLKINMSEGGMPSGMLRLPTPTDDEEPDETTGTR
jgi:hypothetical protein